LTLSLQTWSERAKTVDDASRNDAGARAPIFSSHCAQGDKRPSTMPQLRAVEGSQSNTGAVERKRPSLMHEDDIVDEFFGDKGGSGVVSVVVFRRSYLPVSRMAMSFLSRSLARSESGTPFLAASAAR
jgi:hypothetical protein